MSKRSLKLTMYDMGDGAFNVEVCTGIHIAAKNRKQAMLKVEPYVSLTSPLDFSCCFEPQPVPHIVVTGFDTFHSVKTYPAIVSYKILRNVDSPKKMFGYPVFSAENFETVSETQFLKEMSAIYDEHTPFESESYWVEKHHELK